jgi:phytoene dehydrogenase-like protein
MKKVSIVGAGIAGLSAGCYLQMNGYDTQIFELHKLPGGVCTSWKRKGFTIDNCIHWLVGSNPAGAFGKLWNELIDMEKIEFVDPEEFFRIEGKDGRCIRVFADIDRLEDEMLSQAPGDAGIIREFTGAARKFLRIKFPVEKARETCGPLDGLKTMFSLLPYLKAMKKWSSLSIQEYADRCRDPLLARTFAHMFLPETVVLFIIMTIAWLHNKDAGYPIGGSLEFTRLIEKRYLELGGKINYKSKVVEIITENDSATGIRLEDGQTHSSDIVVSAADGHYTIFDMLGGRYIDDRIKGYYENYQIFPSYFMVSLGVSRTFENEPGAVVLPLDEPFKLDEQTTIEDVHVRIFNFDRTMAPEGKTVITALLPSYEYEYWENLKKADAAAYKQQKERIADKLIQVLEERFGNVKSNVEMTDVSTPATLIRYTNNWRGSFEGWLMTPKTGAFSGFSKTLPGLKNFYMIGQWVEPGGGVPSAMLSARDATQIICKQDGKKFTAKR